MSKHTIKIGGSGGSGGRKAYFGAQSFDTISVGTDPDNPSFLTGFQITTLGVPFTIDVVTGAVQNNSGRVLPFCKGTISFQPDKSGGGTTLLYFWSERSLDGISWQQNAQSLRTLEVSNNGETFKTTVSEVLDWQVDEQIRFRMYSAAGGSLDFVSPTATVLGGEIITGGSVVWELSEA